MKREDYVHRSLGQGVVEWRRGVRRWWEAEEEMGRRFIIMQRNKLDLFTVSPLLHSLSLLTILLDVCS